MASHWKCTVKYVLPNWIWSLIYQNGSDLLQVTILSSGISLYNTLIIDNNLIICYAGWLNLNNKELYKLSLLTQTNKRHPPEHLTGQVYSYIITMRIIL